MPASMFCVKSPWLLLWQSAKLWWKQPKRTTSSKPSTYESIGDFVYANMTVPGGIVDRGMELNLSQLKALRKLVNAEIKEKKNK